MSDFSNELKAVRSEALKRAQEVFTPEKLSERLQFKRKGASLRVKDHVDSYKTNSGHKSPKVNTDLQKKSRLMSQEAFELLNIIDEADNLSEREMYIFSLGATYNEKYHLMREMEEIEEKRRNFQLERVDKMNLGKKPQKRSSFMAFLKKFIKSKFKTKPTFDELIQKLLHTRGTDFSEFEVSADGETISYDEGEVRKERSMTTLRKDLSKINNSK